MSKPGFEGFKYLFWGDVVDYAMSGKTNMEVGWNGTGENIPAEVLGG